MVMTTSLALASSAGVAATAAPAVASGLHFSAERFQTVSVWPTLIRRCPIAAPILPRPATPIFIAVSLCARFFMRQVLIARSPYASDRAPAYQARQIG